MAYSLDRVIELTQSIKDIAPKEWLPPIEGSEAKSQTVVYVSLVKDTRGYIEKIANQINGCYENGWFDACAVMIRRLLETLIIEVYEAHNISHKIQTNGEFMFLRDMISSLLKEKTWNLGRNTKKSLPRLKDIGDKSAHSRRFNAIRNDIDDIRSDLRGVLQELIYLANLK